MNNFNVVCLCGSIRFKQDFEKVAYELETSGKVVLSPCFNPYGDEECSQELKDRFDTLHREKIRMADYIVVINVHQYIGVSTRGEIECAERLGKPVFYYECPRDPMFGLKVYIE